MKNILADLMVFKPLRWACIIYLVSLSIIFVDNDLS